MLKRYKFFDVFQNQVKYLMCECFSTTLLQAELEGFLTYVDAFLLQRLRDSYIQNKLICISKWKQFYPPPTLEKIYFSMHALNNSDMFSSSK